MNTVIGEPVNPVIYIPHSKRLLEQLCEVLRFDHYSVSVSLT